MTMTFEEALAQPGPLLAAWDLTLWKGERPLTIYSLAEDKATPLAYHSAPAGQEESLSAPLRARGIPLGESDGSCEFVWLRSSDRVAVWGPRWRVMEAAGDTV